MSTTKDTKHTSGPWVVPSSVSARVVNTELDVCVAVCERDAFSPPGWDECAANARLIAAAPELLAACEAAKKHLEPDLVEPGRTVFWKLVDAIAKAKGGAQ